MSTGFGYEGLSGSRWAVEEDAFPGFTGAFEYLWKANGHNDCLLEGLLCFGETSDVVPGDVGFLANDDLVETVLHFLFLIFGFRGVKYFLLALIVFDVLAHGFDLIPERVENFSKSDLCGLVF